MDNLLQFIYYKGANAVIRVKVFLYVYLTNKVINMFI